MPIATTRDLPDYGLYGAHNLGVATPARGETEDRGVVQRRAAGRGDARCTATTAKRSSVLSGRGEAVSDAGTAAFEAPCTLVLPAGAAAPAAQHRQ